MNKVILVGRIATNLELQTTKSAINYLRFSLAVSRKNSNNDITDFIPIVAWRHTANFLANNSFKGSRILVEGSFITNKYVNTQGQSVTSYEVSAENITLLETKDQTEMRKNKSGSSFEGVKTYAPQQRSDDATFAPIQSSMDSKSNNGDEDGEEFIWDMDNLDI